MAKVRITDTDRGALELLHHLHQFKLMTVRVGIIGEKADKKHKDSKKTNVEIGTHHEFGAPRANIPQRSFIRAAADENRQKYEDLLKKKVRALIRNPMKHTTIGILKQVGETARRDVVKRIKARIEPALSDRTVARKKGESIPLVDTGALVGSITSGVGRKGR